MRSLVLSAIVVAASISGFSSQSRAQSVEAPPGTKLLLEATGEGNQIYRCTDGKWVLKAPDARLLNAERVQIGVHLAGPTWRLSDGSEVKGKLIASQPAPNGRSVPWLLLGAVPGSGSGKFAAVAYIRRTQTSGGVAPDDSCTTGELPVPYTAKYSFYVK